MRKTDDGWPKMKLKVNFQSLMGHFGVAWSRAQGMEYWVLQEEGLWC